MSTETTTWFDDRTWSVSGNKEDILRVAKEQNNSTHKQSSSTSIVYPKSTNEISELLTKNKHVKIAVVCGGHSSSNVATWPIHNDSNEEVIILDMKEMASISVNKQSRQLTVEGGVLLRNLAETCKEEKCALPIGTGDTVGVCGYVLNSGISGYFGKRLGMLGQRVTQLEIVLANGEVKTLSSKSTNEQDKDLFRACLGVGASLGVVTSLTLQMEDDSSFKTGGSLVFACTNKVTAKPFLEKALLFLTKVVLPLPSVSMEIVITSDYTVICTFMFYDTFDGDPEEFVQQLRDDAKACNVQCVADAVTSHSSWFSATSSLWEVIGGMRGEPLVRLDHCIGTVELPSAEVLDFVIEKWVGEFLSNAPLSLVEIRTLGGAGNESNNLISGNAKCLFFADMIVSYDGSGVEPEDKLSISNEVHDIISEAKKIPDLQTDFSGTHCQPDDSVDTLPTGDAIFGSKENHEFVKDVKKRIDPGNMFCFHPFTHLI